jgi:RNA polymerase sigma-70 factor (ECF subfamily)
VENVTELLARDLDAGFERMVRVHQDRVYAFALALCRKPDEAEDVAQDAFIRAYRALERYPAERRRDLKPAAWLHRIALNVVRNRARGKRPQFVVLEGELRDEGRGPAELAELASLRDELRERLAQLPERYRVAILLRYSQDLSYEEIAEVLRQPVGTVKSNVHRGLEMLRREYALEVG